MAGERKLPGIGLTGFWNLKSAYKDDMDDNLRRLSVLVQGHVDSRPASLPGSPAQGAIVIPTTGDNTGKIAVYDAGAWVYLMPFAGLHLFDRGTATFIYFNGTTWQEERAAELADAPKDGKAYVRKNGAWVEDVAGSSTLAVESDDLDRMVLISEADYAALANKDDRVLYLVPVA